MLAPFARTVDEIYDQAMRCSEVEQLESLTRLVARLFDDPALEHGAPGPKWDFLAACRRRSSGAITARTRLLQVGSIASSCLLAPAESPT
ncbi:MAG: hypothetical protein HYY25_08865 [Candidatus Wallbacteria bacterium]|nr:hypothetical protein [Candidatus Wallbacteria bacterium]